MNRRIILFHLIILLAIPLNSQTDDPPRGLPIIVTLQFHSLSLPFRHLNYNFRHLGFGLGTEVKFNHSGTLFQQFQVSWNRNREVGNRLFFYTQTGWRPFFRDFFSELKLGAGYLLAYRPVDSYRPENGNWIPVGTRGKGLFSIPVTVSFGYQQLLKNDHLWAPFASYQFMVVKGYNQDVPVVPETLIQVGSRLNLK